MKRPQVVQKTITPVKSENKLFIKVLNYYYKLLNKLRGGCGKK